MGFTKVLAKHSNKTVRLDTYQRLLLYGNINKIPVIIVSDSITKTEHDKKRIFIKEFIKKAHIHASVNIGKSVFKTGYCSPVVSMQITVLG